MFGLILVNKKLQLRKNIIDIISKNRMNIMKTILLVMMNNSMKKKYLNLKIKKNKFD